MYPERVTQLRLWNSSILYLHSQGNWITYTQPNTVLFCLCLLGRLRCWVFFFSFFCLFVSWFCFFLCVCVVLLWLFFWGVGCFFLFYCLGVAQQFKYSVSIFWSETGSAHSEPVFKVSPTTIAGKEKLDASSSGMEGKFPVLKSTL